LILRLLITFIYHKLLTFNCLQHKTKTVFQLLIRIICYTGTMSDIYDPISLINSLKQVLYRNPGLNIKLQIVGQITDSIKREILKTGLNAEFINVVPHDQVNAFQVNADILLLIIPNITDAQGILPGKLFEYMASENSILCIGPKNSDTAKILKECRIGETFERDEKQAIIDFIEKAVNAFNNDIEIMVKREEIEKYSREKQAGMIKEVIDQLSNQNL